MTDSRQTVSVDLDSVVSWSDSQLSGWSDDVIVVMDIANNKHFGFDEIGQRIWRAMEKPTRVGAVADQLCEVYQGDRPTITVQLLEFVNRLMEQGLLVLR